MRRILFSLFLACLCTTTATADTTPRLHTDFPRGEVIPKVVTLADPEQQYSLFVPENYDPETVWPVLIVLDPRGRAEAAMELYVEGARRHGWIVLSSYQSRSDTYSTVTSDAFKALLKDLADRKFSTHLHRLYLTGMSGTAFICWHFAEALSESVAGVISVGAGWPRDLEAVREISFDYYGIAGTSDFNYQRQRQTDQALEGKGANHRFDVWQGPHGWPPDAELTVAGVDWMELMAMKRGLTPRREDFIDQQLARTREQAEDQDDPLGRLRALRQMVRDFEGLRELPEERRVLQALEKEREVRRALDQQEKLARQEVSYRSRLDRWIATVRRSPELPENQRSLADLQVKRLQSQIADTSDPYAAHSAARRLETAWVHAAHYLPTEFDERGQPDRARQLLELADQLFPGRPGPLVNLAALHSQAGRIDRAFEYLKVAAQNGAQARWFQGEAWEKLRKDPRWVPFLDGLEQSD